MKNKNEIINPKSDMIYMDNICTICKSTVKIILPDEEKGTGFFIKFQRNNNPFYCLMTNQHVIGPERVENKETIWVYYDHENNLLEMKLKKNERIIIHFEETYNIDVTIVEIIPKDKVHESYFLSPYLGGNITNFDYSEFLGRKIQIIQYPQGKKLSYSEGVIRQNYTNNINIFIHDSKTKPGSSGAPIVLKGHENILGIHKAAVENSVERAGIYIGIIVEVVKYVKKNGFFVEYYDNGNLRYEGKFKDDMYEDENAKFVFYNGDFYIGPFKNGQKEGKGIEYYNDRTIKYEGQFSNDQYNGIDGRFYYPNGDCYIGEFKDGKKNGKGYIIQENNNYLLKEGTFEDDEFVEGTDYTTRINKIKSFFKTVKTSFNPVRDLFKIKCKVCEHLLKNHQELDGGYSICYECPKDSNLCQPT